MSDVEQQQLVDQWGPAAPADERASTVPFITDDQILRRVKQAETGVTALEYQIGVVKRELADLRTLLEPRETV